MSQTPPPSKPSSGPPDRRALLEAFQDVVRAEQQKSAEPARAPATPARHTARALLLLAAAVLVMIVVVKPRWLFARPEPETQALVEASLRVRMYVEISRIEHFHTDKGRLPTSLLEAGGDTTGLRYETAGDDYSVTGGNQGVSLTYRSGTDPREFLGDSYKQISARRRR